MMMFQGFVYVVGCIMSSCMCEIMCIDMDYCMRDLACICC